MKTWRILMMLVMKIYENDKDRTSTEENNPSWYCAGLFVFVIMPTHSCP